MGIIQHRQIADTIRNVYFPQLDVSDITGGLEEEREVHALSRGLASFVLGYSAQLDPAAACLANTDSFQDNGLDAIYYDRNEKTLFLVQSKWNTSHTGAVDKASIHKFVQGVKDVLNSRRDRFGPKITARWQEIETTINQARKVTLVVVYSGSRSFSPDCKTILENAVAELDETGEMIGSQVVSQAQLHSLILEGAIGSPINVALNLFEWGHTPEPLKAYYGQVAASDLVDLHKRYGERLFSKNIRMFLGGTSDVNSGIQQTAIENPHLFWYLNNGITALSSNVTRRAIGGASRESGIFDCEGFAIVNGAQTVGSLSTANDRAAEPLRQARVPIRVVSLRDGPEGFASLITRTNNTQNRIDSRNFVALDPEQERLRAEFAVDKIDYEFRQGEIENSGPNRLGLVEATIALACTQPNVDLAVQAKREIGKLWEDITRPPYKILFNPSRTSEEIWKKVTAFRRIDGAVSRLEFQTTGRTSNAVTHGNRFLAHVTYRELVRLGKAVDLANATDAEITNAVAEAITQMMNILDASYADNYVASLFKNLSKCKDIASRISIAPDRLDPMIVAQTQPA